MTKKQILIDNNTYEILQREKSSWSEVTKNGNFLALVMNIDTAYQVIYNDSGCGYFLNNEHFTEIGV